MEYPDIRVRDAIEAQDMAKVIPQKNSSRIPATLNLRREKIPHKTVDWRLA